VQPENYLEGLLLFSRYAFPCAKEEWDDFDWLKKIVEKKCEPNGWLLEYRFGNACKSYVECGLCRESGYKADFSRESVAFHWRYHHEGKTPVSIATVLEVSREMAMVISGSKTFWVSNPFKHLLEPMITSVSVHNNMIIETIE